MTAFWPCFILNKIARIINENEPGWYSINIRNIVDILKFLHCVSE